MMTNKKEQASKASFVQGPVALRALLPPHTTTITKATHKNTHCIHASPYHHQPSKTYLMMAQNRFFWAFPLSSHFSGTLIHLRHDFLQGKQQKAAS